MKGRHYGLLLLSIALVSACATSPTGRSQLMLVSPETAIVESEKAYVNTVKALGEENKLLNDPAINKRIQAITGRVVYVAEQQYPRTRNWKWSVAVIDDAETVNAWAMAGGRMAVYTGLLEQLKLTDAELAQIMGHEIAHALANHTAEQMSVAMMTQVGVTAVGIATDASDTSMTAGAIAAQLAVQLPNSRTAESESDRIGIELAARAGYDPAAAVTLWQKMEKVGGGGPPQFLSTHPAPGDRQATLGKLVPKMRKLQPATLGPVAPVTLAR
ncbi:M48 family metallopeptidase [Thiohalophilus thiocyanatoxydans]|uniref:Peptidase M48-like protein n=1 Tax=Thiohalophilus thiocyanatoxydans TaxID=381308 RepID=A0A4R8IS54_9GAMM|nr:M48 family metallopeptidase [Thiohalophilus thiocyanatoxydans]TDY03872.1 peptidase M48-like protein [Thiohalophilus thiocyanatoxydans]